MTDTHLGATLAALATLMQPAVDPWCVFGGAAMVLHGFEPGPPNDIDVLVSSADMERLLGERIGEAEQGSTTGRFGSRYFWRAPIGPIEVEIMSDFTVHTDNAVTQIPVGTPVAVQVGTAAIPVASVDTLSHIFATMGRDKDLARLATLNTGR